MGKLLKALTEKEKIEKVKNELFKLKETMFYEEIKKIAEKRWKEDILPLLE
jgi:hypothetical protein